MNILKYQCANTDWSIIKRKVFVFVLSLFLLNTYAFASSLDELVVATENKHAHPWYLGEKSTFDKNKPGTAVELLLILGKKLNLKIKFQRFPFKRALLTLKHGGADMLMVASYKVNREGFGRFPMKNGKVDPSRSFDNYGYTFYKRVDSNVDWDGEQFTNVNAPIATGIGYSIINELQNKGVEVKEVNSIRQALKMLALKRVDGVAAFDHSKSYYIKDPNLKDKITSVKELLTNKYYYYMLSHKLVKKHPELAEKIWDTVAEIKQTEEFQKIIEKYYPET